jgi:ribosome-associated protein YbcJ (S4-like RNA binding protein)
VLQTKIRLLYPKYVTQLLKEITIFTSGGMMKIQRELRLLIKDFEILKNK